MPIRDIETRYLNKLFQAEAATTGKGSAEPGPEALRLGDCSGLPSFFRSISVLRMNYGAPAALDP